MVKTKKAPRANACRAWDSLEPPSGLGPETPSLPWMCSTNWAKAATKNAVRAFGQNNGGRSWIWTSVGSRRQIYSLLPLTTRPSYHSSKAARGGTHEKLFYLISCVCQYCSCQNMGGFQHLKSHRNRLEPVFKNRFTTTLICCDRICTRDAGGLITETSSQTPFWPTAHWFLKEY